MTQKIEELLRVRVGSSEPSPPRRCSNRSSSRGVAEGMAGEFQKSILEVGAMDVKLDDFLADFGGAFDHVGNLVDGRESERRGKFVEHFPWKFTDAGDTVGPSFRQRFHGNDFEARLCAGQRDQFGDSALRDYLAVIDQHDSVAESLRLFHVMGAVENRAATARGRFDDGENPSARLRIDAGGWLIEHD